jgi:hypothetical protein
MEGFIFIGTFYFFQGVLYDNTKRKLKYESLDQLRSGEKTVIMRNENN